MAEIGIALAEARAQLGALVERARSEHTPVYLLRRGERVAAIVDAGDYDELLEQLEDLADVRAAEEARREMDATGATPIPWEEVKADLGLS